MISSSSRSVSSSRMSTSLRARIFSRSLRLMIPTSWSFAITGTCLMCLPSISRAASELSACSSRARTSFVMISPTVRGASVWCAVGSILLRGSGSRSSVIRSPSVTIPTSHPSSSTTGSAAISCCSSFAAASLRCVSGRTVITGELMMSLMRKALSFLIPAAGPSMGQFALQLLHGDAEQLSHPAVALRQALADLLGPLGVLTHGREIQTSDGQVQLLEDPHGTVVAGEAGVVADQPVHPCVELLEARFQLVELHADAPSDRHQLGLGRVAAGLQHLHGLVVLHHPHLDADTTSSSRIARRV